MKFCVDCAHYLGGTCTRRYGNERDPVTGDYKRGRYWSPKAGEERNSNLFGCGKKAKYFKEKA